MPVRVIDGRDDHLVVIEPPREAAHPSTGRVKTNRVRQGL